MSLETNPGFRKGTVPTVELLTPVSPDVDLLWSDLEGTLGYEAAMETVRARVKDLGHFAGFELRDHPTDGCMDWLTYRS